MYSHWMRTDADKGGKLTIVERPSLLEGGKKKGAKVDNQFSPPTCSSLQGCLVEGVSQGAKVGRLILTRLR